MKKKVIGVVSAILIIIAITELCSLIFGGYTIQSLAARAYTGNRIIVNIHARIDGKSVSVTKRSDLKLSEEEQYENANDISTVSSKEDYNVLKCPADCYGPHNFYLLVDNKYPIVINMYQWNWWDIQRSDLYIDIDTKNNCMTYYDEYTSLLEIGIKQKNKNDKTSVSDIDSVTYIWAGSM